MYEIPLLLVLKTQLVHMTVIELLILVVLVFMVIQNARRNHLLRSMDRSLKMLPAVSQARQISTWKNRAAG